MRVYLKNNHAKFHPHMFWNDRDLDFFEEGRPNKNKYNKMTFKWVAIWDQFLI